MLIFYRILYEMSSKRFSVTLFCAGDGAEMDNVDDKISALKLHAADVVYVGLSELCSVRDENNANTPSFIN